MKQTNRKIFLILLVISLIGNLFFTLAQESQELTLDTWLKEAGVTGDIKLPESVKYSISKDNILKTDAGTYNLNEIVQMLAPDTIYGLSKNGKLEVQIKSPESSPKILEEKMQYAKNVVFETQDSCVQLGSRNICSAKVEYTGEKSNLQTFEMSASSLSDKTPLIKYYGKSYSFKKVGEGSDLPIKVATSDRPISEITSKGDFDLVLGKDGKFDLNSKGINLFEGVRGADGKFHQNVYRLLDNGKLQKSSLSDFVANGNTFISDRGQKIETKDGEIKTQPGSLPGDAKEGSIET